MVLMVVILAAVLVHALELARAQVVDVIAAAQDALDVK